MLTVQVFGKVPELVCGLTRDLRVLWALEELGLSYEIQGLDFRHLQEEALSPFAQLPSITDDGVVLSESGAILNYLSEKIGDTRRLEISRWSYAALSTLEPAVLVVNFLSFGGGDAATLAKLTQIIDRHLGTFDRRLANQSYIVDDEFSVADILMTTVLRQLDGLGIVDKYENVVTYKQRCEARPKWQQVLDQQEVRLGVPRGAARRTVPERKQLMA